MNEGTTTLRVEQVLLLENLETSIPEASSRRWKMKVEISKMTFLNGF